MKHDYYRQELFVARVDENDQLIGKVDRWKAHEEGILHRGFTVIMMFDGKYLLQHRKHPAFDGYWDFTFSSHQLFMSLTPEPDEDAIYRTLQREWNLDRSDLLAGPAYLDKVYYRAKDPNSRYTEHEFDYIYSVELTHLPEPNPEYAYGYDMVGSLKDVAALPVSYMLAPWVQSIVGKVKIGE